MESTDLFATAAEIPFFAIMLIIVVAVLCSSAVSRLLPWLATWAPERHRMNLLSTVPVARLAILVSAIVLIVPQVVEPDLRNLFAILGAVGLALGFAFKDYAASLIAGIVTLYERPYRVGDFIEFDGHRGEVEHIGLRALRLHTPADDAVTIPHMKLWDSSISNATAGELELLCCIPIHAKGPHDPSATVALLRDVALTSPWLQPGRPVSVAVLDAVMATTYEVRAYPVDSRHQQQLCTDVTVRGKMALAEHADAGNERAGSLETGRANLAASILSTEQTGRDTRD